METIETNPALEIELLQNQIQEVKAKLNQIEEKDSEFWTDEDYKLSIELKPKLEQLTRQLALLQNTKK